MRAIAQSDEKAFREFYNIFGAMVYNTALSYAQNKEDAEEITQDVFVRIFKNAAKFKGNSAVSTWVYRITINCSINHLKRKKRKTTLGLGADEVQKVDFEHPGVILENKEKAKYLFKAIESLPATQKTAFILSFIEELPRQEVADIMQTSLKAVESLLQRAKKNLRLRLESMAPKRKK